MKGNIKNVWVELARQQARSYRLATAVVTKSIETSWGIAPATVNEVSPPGRTKPLNPLEFHGKRQTEWPRW